MKKYFLTAFIVIALFGFSGMHTYVVADSSTNLGYVPLEPIPGVTSSDLTSPQGFSSLINAIFKILITGGALLAVLSLTIGGVQYMTSSSVGNKTQGLDRAKAAIYGMILIAAIYLILNTINPQLLNFAFIVCPGGTASCGTAATVNPNGTVTIPAAPAANIGTLTPAQIQTGEANGTISGNLANIPNNTFTWTSGASPSDINAQYTVFANACMSAHGSIQSGPPTGDNNQTLSSVCVQQ